ncbi:MAG: Alkaline phosphatase synthesis transcriptional regulatory protein PhoP [Candidatus Omnitrophica bacterium]|nr:Alkaline phosphatase synthesis transcriptional regulatory protein PhoP [Candidatus Omnitrophota bacterium]
MMSRQTILVIDDDKDIQKLLQYNLEKEGFQALVAKTGEEGLEMARTKSPSLVVLDLMLPGIDGLEVCRLLRAERTTRTLPVLMLTAKGSETDQVVGLELGANDYITKPFSVKVLVARVRNLLRRAETPEPETPVLKHGDITLDRERMSVTVKGKQVQLTKLEFRILAFLMEHPGKVFSRDRLLSGAWEGEAFVVDRTVDVHIKSIRQKLGKSRDVIETVRGSGYRLAEDVE